MAIINLDPEPVDRPGTRAPRRPLLRPIPRAVVMATAAVVALAGAVDIVVTGSNRNVRPPALTAEELAERQANQFLVQNNMSVGSALNAAVNAAAKGGSWEVCDILAVNYLDSGLPLSTGDTDPRTPFESWLDGYTHSHPGNLHVAKLLFDYGKSHKNIKVLSASALVSANLTASNGHARALQTAALQTRLALGDASALSDLASMYATAANDIADGYVALDYARQAQRAGVADSDFNYAEIATRLAILFTRDDTPFVKIAEDAWAAYLGSLPSSQGPSSQGPSSQSQNVASELAHIYTAHHRPDDAYRVLLPYLHDPNPYLAENTARQLVEIVGDRLMVPDNMGVKHLDLARLAQLDQLITSYDPGSNDSGQLFKKVVELAITQMKTGHENNWLLALDNANTQLTSPAPTTPPPTTPAPGHVVYKFAEISLA